jgi:hypothetical protein
VTALLPRSHANFRDPVGLLLRMLRSGDRAARAVLFREASAVGLAPLDRALELLERRRLRSAPAAPGPLILIVGGSRAGTTLTYQVLARYLPVTYFSNLSSLFPRAPLTASLFFGRSRRPPGDTFHNYYGNTTELAGPNDGFHIWNRWLGTDRYRAPQRLDDGTVADMRRFFAAWTSAFGRPLLNKNNRNADCVALLGRVLPEATFLVVRRDPVEVAQSLLVAREHVQGDKRYRWGVGSLDGGTGEDPMGYVESVCRQVVEVEQRLAEGVATLSPERVIDVRYERFCADAHATIDELSRRVWQRPADAGGGRFEVPLRASSGRERVSAAERERIERCLSELRERPAEG